MSVQEFRNPSGGLVDRSRALSFTFDGRRLEGYGGDTLASALLANGVRLVGRSFKYHRPRGVMALGDAEPSALVELRTGGRREPNTKATTAELYEGLEAVSQNRWPSLAFDVMAVNQLFSPFLVAGFYYKTFMWPSSFWEPVYERLIRRAAGLGRVAAENDPDHYEKLHAHADLLVIGGGPAGLMAALTAGRAGARVVLVESDARCGGQLIHERLDIDGAPAAKWVEGAVAELTSLANVRLLTRSTVLARYDGGTFAVVERVGDHTIAPEHHLPRQRLWRFYTRDAILAAGATERGIVFAGNDRPGVMTASAARGFANRYGVRAGSRAVVFGNNDDIARTADDLAAAGIEIAAVVDPRPGAPGIEGAGRHLRGHVIQRVMGGRAVAGVAVQRTDDNLPAEEIACDLVAVAGGWSANFQIATHLGAKASFDPDKFSFHVLEPGRGLNVVGAAAGRWGTAECLAHGAEAGQRAAAGLGRQVAAPTLPRVEDRTVGNFVPLYRVKAGKGGPKGKAFVDFQNDVTDKDIELAVREGYDNAEHAKRYTTLGMATDQGKTGHVNGAAIMAEALGLSPRDVGTSVARAPYVPVSLGTIGGHSVGKQFQPTRLTAMHAWHERNGAVFMEAGQWYRPSYYAPDGEKDWLKQAIRETKAVREGVGIADVSTLGKIDIQGPDAAEFLNRLYINNWLKLPVGRARYGVMLREDGFVMDDGTTSRLGEDRFLMTTTTAAAGQVMTHIEFCHQAYWPDLDVQYISVTEQWAQIAIAGPKSRAVLEAGLKGADLSNAALPFMGVVDVRLSNGIPGRLFRISFSGELAYEIAVPADYGQAAWEHFMKVGAPHAITPYGLEALNILRIEKGHVTHSEIDGRTSAADLGFDKMTNRGKDFIGRMASERPAFLETTRPVLVGLKAINPQDRLYSGAHFLPIGAEHKVVNDQGWMSSVAFSPALGCWIGLGFVKRGRERIGERLVAAEFLRGSEVQVEIVETPFVDPKGERLHG
ncbi:MAG: sarcosine oxidase subunit alpha family protein [Rhizobiales bacterium]|nr:sarcosine oxidase subunit alpha family protein [Hyphomicrobiales bacterium]